MDYNNAHIRTRRSRGPANNYPCPCGKQAAHWALIHDALGIKVDERGYSYSDSPEDYTPMCASCHMRYDKSTLTHCPRGHAYDDENTIYDSGKRKCKACVYERNTDRRRRLGLTPEQHARRIELQRERRAREKARMLADENYSAERFICGAPCPNGGREQASRRGGRSDLGWMGHCNTHVKTAGMRCWRHKEQPA